MAETEANLRASIGNYKGVMLCTRPNEDAGQKKERPFISRVEIHDDLGINPVKKKMQAPERKATNIVLKRHKEWLQKFQQDIQSKKEEEEIRKLQEEERRRVIRENAAADRVKMKTLKEEFNKANDSMHLYGDNKEENLSPVAKPAKLTAKNLQKLDEETSQHERQEAVPEPPRESEKPAKKSKKGKEKPKWAMTEQELEGVENAEVDDLLDFANNLDYDQFMYDMEVRNMVNAIQSRINELKQQDNWKEKVVEEWNKNKTAQDGEKEKRTKGVTFDDNRSQASNQSKKSVQSIKSQIREERKLDEKASEWDGSTTTKKLGVEERIAKLVADEILKNNPNLRSVHSNNSIRKILEREAAKMVEDDGMHKSPNPVIATTKDYTLGRSENQPSNLPYLHRNPAI